MQRIREPNYEAALVLVRHLDNEILRDLVNDDVGVANLVKNVNQCRDLETEKELIMTQNKSLAEYNLSLGPKLQEGKSKLKDLYDSVRSVLSSVEEKQAEIKRSTGGINGETALGLLQTAAAESEEESEKIVQRFYEGVIDTDRFLEDFQRVRKEMHLRRVKADKMKDLLLKKHSNTNANGPYPQLPSAVPYPVGAINMPYFPMAK